jgi:M6 family metalloprotease-like protein
VVTGIKHADGRRAVRSRLGVLATLILLLGLTGVAGAERWIPIEPSEALRESLDPAGQLRRDRHSEIEGITAGLRRALQRPVPAELAPGERAEPSSVNVMVLRLAFRENRRPDLTTVPVDGKFMADTDTLATWLTRVDPPPHDAAYFDAHMGAMAEFYRIQSFGQLTVNWDMIEGPEEGLFLLPDIADYGPGEAGDYWTLELLEAFVRTALDSIDAELQAVPTGPRFADYDHVMVFHAGSDLQNDIFGDSPNDLPSFNIFFGEPALVDGGDTELASLLLLPETTTQDTDPENPVYGALNAVTAHEFGHQLGLVDTYNTYWGWPSVGYWDIMDSGHQILYGFETLEDPDNPIYVYGALPTSFAIWHRMLLGWVNEADGSLLRPGGGTSEIALGACNLQDDQPKALRVDFSDREYYLLESRQEILHPRPRYVKRDPETGVFLYVAYDHPDDPEIAVNSGEYDLFLPQSGLLIWHVDERDFETIYPLNAINPDHDRHFRLIEADGARDLGDPYSSQWRGNDLDPFYTGNNTELGENTIPGSRLRDGTPSGFVLDSLVTRPYLDGDFLDQTIEFRISRRGVPAGFPRDDRELVENTLALLPAAGSLLSMGDWLTYFMASLDADTLEQSHWIAGGREVAGDPPLAPLPALPVGGAVKGSLDLPAPFFGEDAWLWLGEDSLHLWSRPATGQIPERLLDLELPAAPLGQPLAFSVEDSSWVIWLDADGFLPILSFTGTAGRAGSDEAVLSRHRIVGGRAEGDAAANAPLALTHLAEGWRVIVAIGDTLNLVDPRGEAPSRQIATPDPGEGPFWVLPVDLDGDGRESDDELFWIHVDGRVRSLGEAAVAFELPASSRLSAAPAVADLDGNGHPELFLAAGHRVHRLSFAGHAYSDWPLRLEEVAFLDEPMSVGSGLRAADMTGDGISELILFGDSGHLLVVGDAGRPLLGTPRSLAAAPLRDLIAPGGIVYALSRDGYLLAFEGAGGTGSEPDWAAGGGDATRSLRWQRQHELTTLTEFPAEDWSFYPNPAGVATKLHHPALPAGTRVRLELFDLEGQLKFSRDELAVGDGPFELSLELRSLASGIYYCRIEVSRDGESRHLLRRLGVLR